MNVHVSEAWHWGRTHHYNVFVDGVLYDEFTSNGWLTHRQLIDVARGYEEGLTGVPHL